MLKTIHTPLIKSFLWVVGAKFRPCRSVSTMRDACMLLRSACTVEFRAVLRLQCHLGDTILRVKADLRCSLTSPLTLRPKSKFKSQGKWSTVNIAGYPSLKFWVWVVYDVLLGHEKVTLEDIWQECMMSDILIADQNEKGRLWVIVLWAWGLKCGSDTVSKEPERFSSRKQSICTLITSNY